MHRPVQTVAPATTPVSLEEAKAQCRVDHDFDNALITSLIGAAVSHLDGWTGILGRCLITQTWRQDFDGFNRCLRLPLFPVASITGVKYDDATDTEQTVASGNYDLLVDDLGAFVRFKSDFAFPAIDDEKPAVRIAYVAGDDPANVPASLRQAILMLVGHWYANSDAVVVGPTVASVELPFAVNALIAPFRRMRF